MENDPFEDVFPIENGDFPLLCLITGVYFLQSPIHASEFSQGSHDVTVAGGVKGGNMRLRGILWPRVGLGNLMSFSLKKSSKQKCRKLWFAGWWQLKHF